MKNYLLLSSMFILVACSSNAASEQSTSVTSSVRPSSELISSSANSSEIASSTANSTPKKSDTILKGMMGTYEITNVEDIVISNPGFGVIHPITGKTEYVDEEDGYGHFQLFSYGEEYDTSTIKVTMNYTNTYFSPVTPKDAVQQDFVIEHEDEATISTMYFSIPANTTDELLRDKTIKVGGSAEIEFTILVTTTHPLATTTPGTIYLRNNTGSGINENLFERVITTIPE